MANYNKGDATTWTDSELHMRLAQGSAVPTTVTNSPVEFGEIHAEIHRRQRCARWRLAIGVAFISGSIGIASAGFQEFMGW